MADMRRKENKTLVQRVRDRYKLMYDDDYENRIDALEDVQFVNVPGAQWDENMKQERGKRPCYTYNKTKVRCKRVVNDIRDNRPQGKVRAVEDGDTDTAEIFEGLIRNILTVSHADDATDYAAEYMVEAGFGAWRVNTKFVSDSTFDQDIVIEMIENPFQLYCDPHAKEMMKRDADDWIFVERISHDLFEERYGKTIDKADFEGDGFDDDDWIDEKTVRVAEYWYKVPVKKVLWSMTVPEDDAQPDQLGNIPTKTVTVDSESDAAKAFNAQGIKPDKKREIDTHKIVMVVSSGKEILEGPVDWKGSYFPWIMIYGEYKVIPHSKGKGNDKLWWGLVRFAKDAQRSLNLSKTSIAETIAQSSKSKVWATPKQAEGLESQWALAHKQNMPFQLYNPDPKAPGPPMRVGAADVPIALMQQAAIDNEDLKDVMGLPDANLGQSGNESSGRAIFARQQQGEIATFNFKDNHAKGIERTHELLIDLIPKIYDTERSIRILGTDGAETYKKINTVIFNPETGKSPTVNDLSVGKYDVTVTVGPAFATLRQEATEMYASLGQQFPAIWEVAGDLIMKSMDLPYADDISDRIKTLLPAQIQQTLNEDTEMPPEVQQAMQQVQQAVQQVQQHGQLVEAASNELEQEKALNEKQKAEIRTEQANVKTARAEFDAHVAQELLKLVQKETGLVTKSADVAVKGAELKEAVADFGQRAMSETVDTVSTVATIDEILARFMQSVDQAMQGLEQKAGELQVKTDRTPVGGTISRDGGKLAANVEFDDGTVKTVSAVRDKGQLRIVPDDDS